VCTAAETHPRRDLLRGECGLAEQRVTQGPRAFVARMRWSTHRVTEHTLKMASTDACKSGELVKRDRLRARFFSMYSKTILTRRAGKPTESVGEVVGDNDE